MLFKNRASAGRALAKSLEKYKGEEKAIILGLPRGGVMVAGEIAHLLGLPLDIVVPRKIGAPGNPELAIGAISEEGAEVLDENIISVWGIPRQYIDKAIGQETAEAARRLALYRGDRPLLDLRGRVAILIDDGLATGATMRAAIKSARAKGADRVVVAVPVAASDSLEIIKQEADEVVCLRAPLFFGAVGAFYEEFGQTSDEEVIELLRS